MGVSYLVNGVLVDAFGRPLPTKPEPKEPEKPKGKGK